MRPAAPTPPATPTVATIPLNWMETRRGPLLSPVPSGAHGSSSLRKDAARPPSAVHAARASESNAVDIDLASREATLVRVPGAHAGCAVARRAGRASGVATYLAHRSAVAAVFQTVDARHIDIAIAA